jgi:structural maintenance of chromosome 3 (chondroitin sulfate proteoglycan 6)
MLEIELKENLRRRYEELKNKIEKLGEAEAGDASAVEELESRNRELKALNAAIEGLQKKIQGWSRF